MDTDTFPSPSFVSDQPHLTEAGTAVQGEVFTRDHRHRSGIQTQTCLPPRPLGAVGGPGPAAPSPESSPGGRAGPGAVPGRRASTPGDRPRSEPWSRRRRPRVGGRGDQGWGWGWAAPRGAAEGRGRARGGRGGGVARGGAAAGGGRVRSGAQGPPWPPRSRAASRERPGAEG